MNSSRGVSGLVRGNADLDGTVDVSDPFRTLVMLSLGPGGEPRCPSSADSDDNGSLDLTDAIGPLPPLLLAGPALPAPFPECGSDPTWDLSGCPTPGRTLEAAAVQRPNCLDDGLLELARRTPARLGIVGCIPGRGALQFLSVVSLFFSIFKLIY